MSEDECQVKGERIALSLVKEDQYYRAIILSHTLDSLSSLSENNEEYNRSIHSCIMNKYFGLQIEKVIPMFKDIHSELVIRNHTPETAFMWGDVDMRAWVEPHDDYKIVCVENLCSGDDNNIFVFILTESAFHGRTVWHRESKDKDISSVYPNDKYWRDINQPSLQTYRKRGWTLGYGDARDKGYAFSYDFFTKIVVGALYNYENIVSSLTELRGLAFALKGE
jgi:hypothetical protein